MNITIAEDNDIDAWNQAVREFPDATFYHRFEWRQIIRRHFRFHPVYLVARDGAAIAGVLPLYFVRRPLLPSVLMSIPLGVQGGIAAADESARNALLEAALQQARAHRAGYIELRNREPLPGEWRNQAAYATFNCGVAMPETELLQSIRGKERAEVRKAKAFGLESRLSRDPEPFYSLYATSMRNLGSPMFQRRYYRSLLEVFGRTCDTLTIYHADSPLVSFLNFYFRDQVLPFYGGGLPAARATKANAFMYWETMRLARARGYQSVDFGRSLSGTGAYRFKKNFGLEPRPLYYQRRLLTVRSVPEVRPDNPSLHWMIAAWKRLPVWMTRRLGPLVAAATV